MSGERRSGLSGPGSASLAAVIEPRARDIGGFEVRRVLPAMAARALGPFVFLDQMGPADFAAGHGLDVRPHPHIGLATLTYLFTGEIVHRDSLGTVQPIRPGEVNWMIAGRGIAHSERTAPEHRVAGSRLEGLQSWVALPEADEEMAPSFAHFGVDALPCRADPGLTMRLVAGSFAGMRSPVPTPSPLFYADVSLAAGADVTIEPEHEERGVYIVAGTLGLAGESFEAGRLLVLRPGIVVTVTAAAPARFVILGGQRLAHPRHLWWNFVSSSEARIARAKSDWKEGRFPKVPGESEFVPLPE